MNSFSEEEIEEEEETIKKAFYTTQKEAIRNFILNKKDCLNKLKNDEIRLNFKIRKYSYHTSKIMKKKFRNVYSILSL